MNLSQNMNLLFIMRLENICWVDLKRMIVSHVNFDLQNSKEQRYRFGRKCLKGNMDDGNPATNGNDCRSRFGIPRVKLDLMNIYLNKNIRHIALVYTLMIFNNKYVLIKEYS